MEDFNDTMSSASPDAFTPQPSSLSTPPPVVVQSRPAKKRKSWGQELPEPKTSLPPRKRAKTDDEKEQRRIERIKRNRAAAHNSRERKRQETETLAVALARANNELNAYRRLHGPLPDSVVLPEVHLCTEDPDESSPAQIATTPAPSLVESHGSQADAQSPASPADSIFYPPIKQEESSFDTTYPSTLPPAFDNLDAKSSLLTLDPTQHSAAMLCDLQCRSSPVSSPTTSQASWWSNLFLYMMTSQLQTCYKTLLVAIWTLSPSRMARLMQASMLRSTSPLTTSSTTLQLLRSTPRCLALSRTATGLSAPRETRQLSRDEVPNMDEAKRAAKRAQQANHSELALTTATEQVTGSEDQAMGDEWDENGVRGRDLR